MARALIVGEPEEPVLQRRAAHRIAELISLEHGDGGSKKLAIQVAVSEKLEHGAVETVGPRFRNGGSSRRREAAVLGVEVVRDQPKLGYRIQVWNYRGAHRPAVAHIAPVDRKALRLRAGC